MKSLLSYLLPSIFTDFFRPNLGSAAAVVSIASGVNSMFGGGGGGSSQSGPAAQQAADPFSPYRGALGAQYADALKPGANTDITQMPGYSQFQSGVMNPALSATQGRLAASGMSMSGSESQELNKVAQQGYYGFMTDYMNRLAQGSGAVNNPATAAGIGTNQGNLQNQAFMQGMGGVVTGLSGLFGGSSPGATYASNGASTVPGVVPGGYQYDGTTYNNPSAYVGP